MEIKILEIEQKKLLFLLDKFDKIKNSLFESEVIKLSFKKEKSYFIMQKGNNLLYVDFTAEVEQEITISICKNLFIKNIKLLTGVISLLKDGNALIIKNNSAQIKLPTILKEDFQDIAYCNYSNAQTLFTMKVRDLLSELKHTIIENNDSLGNVNNIIYYKDNISNNYISVYLYRGVFMSIKNANKTLINNDASKSIDYFILSHAYTDLIKYIFTDDSEEVQVKITDNAIFFCTHNVMYSFPLVEKAVPRYETIKGFLSESGTSFSLKREELLKNLQLLLLNNKTLFYLKTEKNHITCYDCLENKTIQFKQEIVSKNCPEKYYQIVALYLTKLLINAQREEITFLIKHYKVNENRCSTFLQVSCDNSYYMIGVSEL